MGQISAIRKLQVPTGKIQSKRKMEKRKSPHYHTIPKKLRGRDFNPNIRNIVFAYIIQKRMKRVYIPYPQYTIRIMIFPQ